MNSLKRFLKELFPVTMRSLTEILFFLLFFLRKFNAKKVIERFAPEKIIDQWEKYILEILSR